MSNHDNYSPQERDQLEQELLELHFGCHEDPTALLARLDREPALRALQGEVIGKAQLLEQAVRPEQPPLELPTPTPNPSRGWHIVRSPVARLLTAATIAAATVLGFFVAQQWAQTRHDHFERDHLHLTVSAPRAVPAGAPWTFTVQTADLAGAPRDCRVRWQAFGESGTVLGAGEVAARNGSAVVAMNADLRSPQRVEVIAAHDTDEVREVFQLGSASAGPLVHVSTDRPVYRPGETIYARAVVLDRVTLLPRTPQAPRMLAKLLDAKGSPVGQTFDDETTGVGSFAFVVPPGSTGGAHTIEVSSLAGTFAPETIEVVVRPFRNPQLRTQIVLDRTSYAPGARGSAEVTVERMGGGFAAGAAARGALVVDGTEVWNEQVAIAADGKAQFRFTIPQQVDKGAARFVATITDGGVVETELEPFVVPTGIVHVAAFPEGGELVGGVANSVYLECTDPLSRPIDTSGVLLDAGGQVITKFQTAHQGRAKLTFTPRAGVTYRVQLAGQQQPVDLPAVQERGIAMQLAGDDIAAGAALRMQLAGRGDGPWLLGVFCRGVLVGQATVREGERGELRTTAEVPLPAYAAGVLRATVFDRTLRPVAERLVRRASSHRIDIDVAAEHPTRVPGEPQQVKVTTKDERGEPIAAVVGLSVTDLAVTSLGSEPRIGLGDHAALFADVEKLEQLGDFFLGNVASARNVDLLLGTRGWRRFVWRNDAAAQKVLAEIGPKGEGVLAREGFSHTPQVSSNLEAASAPGAALQRAVWSSQRSLKTAAGVSLFVMILLLLGEGAAFALRRLTDVGHPQLAGFASAAVLLVGTLAILPQALGAPDEVKAVAEMDFDVEVAQGAAFPAAAAAEPMNPEYLELGVNGWIVDRLAADPAANPLAGAFFNDGGEGDIRARGENFFAYQPDEVADAKPGVNLRLVLPGDDVPLFEAAEEAKQGLIGFVAAGGRAARSQQLHSRVYAHQHQPHDGRTDFTPTIYWNSLLTTDQTGSASVSFSTSDAVTTWQVHADAHAPSGPSGRVGQAQTTFTTQLPFHLEAKLPDEVSAGDELSLPINAVVTGAFADDVELRVEVGAGLKLRGEAPTTIKLVGGRGRVLVEVTPEQGFGRTFVRVTGKAGRFTDQIVHPIAIAPRGFPHRRSHGGTVENGKPAVLTVAIPTDVTPNSGKVTFKLFPSPLSALTEGLNGILQEPHGCFEQASSSNYPNTLVLTLLDASGDDVPAIASRARQLLPRGYQKITGYECKEKGYEWFGGDPGHEALTAYGLLQFHDMQKVYDVDAGMVERTKQWLLDRRDGNGGYQRNPRALDRFGGAPQPTTDAYVTYALLVAGVPATELSKEIEALVGRMATKDAYELAVISCALELAGRPEASLTRQRLAELQEQNGSLRGATASITRSGGQDLLVETAGFAILAWLQDPAYQGHVRKAIEFVQGCRGASGTFGATQATIVALRALTAYAAANRKMREPGTLRILDGDTVIAERAFAAGDVDAITFDLWDKLPAGEHELAIDVTGGGQPLPWACDVSYYSEQPADDPATVLSIRAVLSKMTVTEGQTVALEVEVQNTTAEGQPMAMAIVGLPAGLELPTKVLEDLVKQEAFAFWELRGRELALYWRDLAPSAKKKVSLDLVGRVPGRSVGPASRTYLYYTPAQKRWAMPLVIDVDAAK